MVFSFKLTCTFEVLTPMFLGGADPQQAEVRAPSIKGAMRFWYRAIDPLFEKREPVIFGAGGQHGGQSLLVVRCQEAGSNRMVWSEVRAERFDRGRGRQTTNGLTYLGYPFGLGGNTKRQAIRPGTLVSVVVSCHRAWPKDHDPPINPLRATLASMWTLGHFGALGTRARRGFGALALTRWVLSDLKDRPMPDLQDFGELPLLVDETSASAWEAGARRALEVLQRWFGAFDGRRAKPRHPHFGSRAELVVRASPTRRADWPSALLALGTALQGFRQRQRQRSDYDLVKDHVKFEVDGGGKRIRRAPDRATFGLPLMFRFGSLPNSQPVIFTPVNGARHGSPLLLRPVLAGDQLYGAFLRLDGDVPGIDTPVGLGGTGPSLGPAARSAVDDFMREMKKKG